MKTITANIPARKITGFRDRSSRTIPAYTATFAMSDDGKWSGEHGSMLESDVIDVCKTASNWAAIKAAHFPMVGFHS